MIYRPRDDVTVYDPDADGFDDDFEMTPEDEEKLRQMEREIRGDV